MANSNNFSKTNASAAFLALARLLIWLISGDGQRGHTWHLSTVPDRREDKELTDSLHQDVPNFESKRGLTRRVGMDKALQQQGIKIRKNKKKT
ncbi:hypothetical protein P4V11_05210 [Bacillus subtilis]|nr:hypothetical protein [Bacillus subtilis]